MVFENQCVWALKITHGEKSIAVQYPLTCEFNVSKSCSGASFCTLNIYNLGKDTRLSKFFRFDHQQEAGRYMLLDFFVGYGLDVTVLFSGQVENATSYRKGTNVITTIQARDSGHCNKNRTITSFTFKQGTTFSEAFDIVAGKLTDVKLFAKGTLNGVFETDTTLTGTPLDILNQITGNHTFVDNKSLIFLNNNEHLAGNPVLLSTKTGLLDVPKVGELWVTANTIFNPTLKLGATAELRTTTLDYYNSIYKIFNINHQGIISGAVGGQRTTSVILQKVKANPNSNVNITQQTEFQGEKEVEGTNVRTPGKVDVQNAYEYIRSNNGDIPKWKINNYVSWKDMIGHENQSSERYNEITPAILANCITIANEFHLFLASKNFSATSFSINSGWRCKRVNDKYSKEERSKHRDGLAIDFYFVNQDTHKAYVDKFKPLQNGWQGYAEDNQAKNYIHVQHGLGKGGARRPGVL